MRFISFHCKIWTYIEHLKPLIRIYYQKTKIKTKKATKKKKTKQQQKNHPPLQKKIQKSKQNKKQNNNKKTIHKKAKEKKTNKKPPKNKQAKNNPKQQDHAIQDWKPLYTYSSAAKVVKFHCDYLCENFKELIWYLLFLLIKFQSSSSIIIYVRIMLLNNKSL